MTAEELLAQARDGFNVRRVFGEPYEKDGLTILPVARLAGGGGFGRGKATGEDTGIGGGMGLRARPMGVFVIKDGDVRWQPAVDVNRIVFGAQAVAIAAMLTLRAFARRRR